MPTATVALSIHQRDKTTILQEAACGDGPVDAAYRAVDKIIKRKFKFKTIPRLVDYSIRSITVGKDAQGEVSIKVSWQEKIYSGLGISTDIIEASIKSYLNVLNKILLEKSRITT